MASALVVVATALLPAATGEAAAPGGPLLVTVNGAPVYVPGSDLNGAIDITGRTATSRFVQRDGTVVATAASEDGVSTKRLLVLLGLTSARVTSMTVEGNRGPIDLSPRDPNEIEDGFDGDPGECGTGCLATFDASYNGGANVKFFLPLRSPDDQNALDETTSAVGDPLRVTITTDGSATLKPVLTGPAQADAGAPVRFGVTNVPADATLRWDFGDGTGVTGDPSPSHTYAKNGSYDPVTVTAIAPDGSSGIASTKIQVGPLTGAATASTPVAADSGAAGAGSGGNGSGGGSAATGGGSGGATAAAGGAATSPTKRRSNDKASDARKGERAPRAGDVAAPAQTPGAARGGAGTATPAAGAAGGSAGTGAPGATATPAANATPAPVATPAAGATTPAAPAAAAQPPASGSAGSTRVRGQLVDGRGPNIAAALAAADALASQTPPRSPSRAAAGHGATIAGGVTGGLVIIGLLGLGAAREWRRLPNALPHA